MTDTTQEHREIDDYLSHLGLTLKVEFIPMSKVTDVWARMAWEKKQQLPDRDFGEGLHWRFDISAPNGNDISGLYSQGIGHIKGYRHIPRSIAADKAIKHSCETGTALCLDRKSVRFAQPLHLKCEPPLLRDIIWSLIMDGDALDLDFADWCRNLGYSDDSINALHLYELCRAYALDLQRMIGAPAIDHLRELFQDY